jgi:hypothetical protein
MRIFAGTSSIATSIQSSTAWSAASATGRIRRSTATCGRDCFRKIGRAMSQLRAASASVFEIEAAQCASLIAPYGLLHRMALITCEAERRVRLDWPATCGIFVETV